MYSVSYSSGSTTEIAATPDGCIDSLSLHGELQENVDMRQPEGFILEGTEHPVCRLKHGIY